MALTNQYLILNPSLKRIGTLTVDGATKFSNDSVKIQLADADTTSTAYDDDVNVGTKDSYTGTINLNAQSKKFDHQGQLDVLQGQPDSDKVVAGNNLAYYDALSGHWYVMHIYSVEENNTAATKHVTTANFTNLCLFTLAHHYPVAMADSDTAIKVAFTSVFSDTGWTLKFNTTNAMIPYISIDGKTKASTLLQTLLQTYNVEVDCYVEIDSQGNVQSKTCEVVDQLNVDKVYNEAIFGKNITSIKRTTVSTPITKLIAYGDNSNTMAAANDGKIYIVDDEANRKYNPDWQSGLYYEGVITANSIEHAAGLKSWAEQMLQLFNHPRTYYEVNVTPTFNPPLGATIRFKDDQITPVLDASGRVIQRTISFANPYGNTVGFGEYVTVPVATPAWLTGYQSAISSAIEKARADASSVKPVALTPDGNNFTDPSQTKRLILQAWEGSTNISAYIDSKGFIWRRYNQNGTVDTSYANTGYLVQAPYSAVGTLHGTIETGYIQSDPEVTLDTTSIKHWGDFQRSDDTVGAYSAVQYMCPLSNGQYLTSRALNTDSTKDTMYVLHDSNFKPLSKMIVQHGGHGASFDVEEVNGVPYIWAATYTDNTHSVSTVSRFPYVAGTTMQANDSRIERYYSMNGYMRVSMDFKHGYVLVGDGNGAMYIMTLADLKNGSYNIKYAFNIFNYGYEASQTYQSQTLDFPYIYWNSGDVDLHDNRMLYGVNVVHGGQEFALNLMLDMDFKTADDVMEPETVKATYDSTGNSALLLTFNCWVNDNPIERVYSLPIKARPAVDTLNTSTTDDNTAD
ncbi:phage baseplate protein [Lactiplantibacillus plantarum]|uniref:phage baseplate protein n=1 Tax=Lactiplantibacillus plantarum TaxID=1590 RepID=UPI003F52F9A8